MAQRIVTHAIRNQKGNILALCNPDSPWLQRRKEWAISDIVADRHEYFVEGQADSLIRIEVVNGPTGPYLRTNPDVQSDNNLDNLPECDRNPWEVSLENAEVLAVHAALVSTGGGQVMLMGGDEHDKSNADQGDFHNTRLYDPLTNTVQAVSSPPADVFCCGHAFLPGGRWLVAGGTEQWNDPVETEEGQEDHHLDGHGNPRNHWSGARDCAIYEPQDSVWTESAPLQTEPGQLVRGGGRWYPTLITLADGRVLAVGGHPRVSQDPEINDGRHGAWLPEIYDPVTNAWTYPGGHWIYVAWGDVDADEVLPPGQVRPENVSNYLYYPRTYTVPGGRVFLVSPNDGQCGWYDPNTGLTELTIERPPHDGRGYAETNHTAVLLPLLPGDGYTPHFLFLGHEGAQRLSLADADAEWEPAGTRDWPPEQVPLRRHGCGVLLPTGEVFFCGGLNHDEGEGGSPDDAGVLNGEIYRPGIDWETQTYDHSQETWETTPPAAVVRNYHSVALLLPDGLVLTAGSNINGSSGGDDVKEYRLEVYSPWYDGDAYRPTITTAPVELGYGQVFAVGSAKASSIRRVALLRCGSVTHAWDGDQRYVGLEFSLQAPGVLQVTAPPSGEIAPPGAYMLWIIDSQGRPCRRARLVTLG